MIGILALKSLAILLEAAGKKSRETTSFTPAADVVLGPLGCVFAIAAPRPPMGSLAAAVTLALVSAFWYFLFAWAREFIRRVRSWSWMPRHAQKTKASELIWSDMVVASMQRITDGKLSWKGTDYADQFIEVELSDARVATEPGELPVELGGGKLTSVGEGRWALTAWDVDAEIVLRVEFSRARYRCSNGFWYADDEFPVL